MTKPQPAAQGTVTRRIAGCATLGLDTREGSDGAVSWIDSALPATQDSAGRMARGAMLVLADQGLARGVFAAFGEEQAMMTLDLRVDWLAPPPAGTRVEAVVERVARHGVVVVVHGLLQAGTADTAQLVATATARFLTGSFPGGGDVFAHVEHQPVGQSAAPSFAALIDMQPGHDEAVMPPSPALVGSPMLPAIHGGFIAAALDAGSSALAPADKGWQAIDTEVRYIRPGLATAPLHVVPRVLRASRRTVIVEAQALQGHDRKLVASAQTLFFRPEITEAAVEEVRFALRR